MLNTCSIMEGLSRVFTIFKKINASVDVATDVFTDGMVSEGKC